VFCEIVYETGRSSIACYEDEAEAKEAIKNHHDRAVKGESGGPLGVPAERIKTVYVYDEHPNDFNPDQTISAEVAASELANAVDLLKDKNGIVSIDQLAVEIRGMSHPMVVKKEGAFDSNFRMKENKKLDLAFLGKDGA
jgi:hypothetical protein